MAPAISQTDPHSEYLACRQDIESAIHRVLDRGRYILDEEVRAFEEEFASYLGARHAIGVGSGTDALHLALRACGVKAGDEVITVSHTAVATVAAIEHAGATPVMVDVDPRSFTLDPAKLPRALTPRTKAIVPVHLYGQPADMAAILDFAQARKLLVIEDCAQAHGAAYRSGNASEWRKVGTLSDAASFSFYPTKNLGAIGDGGCVVTNNAEVAGQVRLLREYGWRGRKVSDISGWNSRLDEMQAAILRVKLHQLDHWNERRRAIAASYDSALTDSDIITPTRLPDRNHVFHQYVVRLKNRDRVHLALDRAGISAAIHYPFPVHRQPAYHALGTNAHLAVTDAISPDILSLPMFPYLEPAAVQRVAQELRLAVAKST